VQTSPSTKPAATRRPPPALFAGLSPLRQLAGALTGLAVLPPLTAVLTQLRDVLSLPSQMLLYLLAVVVVALVGGLVPALAAAVAAAVLLDYYFIPPLHDFAVADLNEVVALVAFVLVAAAVSAAVGLAAGRARAARTLATANATSREELRRLADEQAALRRVATLVAHGTPPAEVLAAVAHEVGHILGADGTNILRLDPDAATTVVARTGAYPAEFPIGSRWKPQPPLALAAVLHTGHPARIDDFSPASDPYGDAVRRLGLRSGVAAPITVEGRLWGAIAVGTRHERFPADTEQRIADFTELIGTAIANAEGRAQLEESRDELHRLAQEQAALRRVATLVARGLPPGEVFAAVAQEVGSVLGADSTSIVRLDPDGAATVLNRVGERPDEVAVGRRFNLEPPLPLAVALRTGRPARLDDFSQVCDVYGDRLRRLGIRSGVAAPIVVEGRLWGAIGIGTRRERLPADTEQRMAGFTELVGTAIANAQARVELRSSAEEQAALRRVATLVASGGRPEEVFAAVTEETGRLLQVAFTLLNRYDPDGTVVTVGTWARTGEAVPFPVGNRWDLGGDNVTTRVFQTGRPARIDAYAEATGPAADLARERGTCSVVGAPVNVGGRRWGFMSTVSTQVEPLPTDTEARLAGFTELVATAIANAEGRAQLEESRDELHQLAQEQAALRRVATLVARGLPPAEVFPAVAQEVGHVLAADTAGIHRLDAEGTTTVVVRVGDPPGAFPVGSRWKPEPPLALAVALRTCRPARCDDVSQAPGEYADAVRRLGLRSSVAAPIVVEGRLWGAIAVGRRRGGFPAAAEQRMAGFTELIGTAIANAEGRGQLEESRDELRRLAQEQAALRRVATLVAGGAPPEEVFTAVTAEVGRLLEVDFTHLGRYDPDGAATTAGVWNPTGGVGPVPGETRWSLGGWNVTTVVFETGQPARIDDYADASGASAVVGREWGFRSAVGVPISVEGQLWGFMLAAYTHEEPLPADTGARLAGFTELVGTAIANAEGRAQLEESRDELRRLADEQAALRRMATLVAHGVRPEEIFAAVSDEVGRLVGTDSATVMRFDDDGPGIVFVGVASNMSDAYPLGARWEFEDGMASAEVYRTGRCARGGARDWSTVNGSVGETHHRLGIVSTVASPIVVEGRLWGAMAVQSQEPLPMDTDERLEKFTELLATAIANADSRSELAASRRRVVTAADDARRRIERDLHDGTQQRLVALSFALRMAQSAEPSSCSALQAEIGRVADELTGALEELRELARGIHPAILSEGGLGPALRGLARRAALPVELDIRTETRPADRIEVAAYYVVSEALTNTTKHARASYAQVAVEERDALLHLSIRDDGIGGADPAGGSGLIGLRDRVQALSGSIEVNSPPGEGTAIVVELPLEPD
jgi:GAF domain-containing protein